MTFFTKVFQTKKPTKKLSEKQKRIARLAGDPRKIDKPDFAKLRNKNKKVI